MRFDELDLEDEILDGLEDMNFHEMTPVQEQTIPVILEGRDIIGCAQTGTGKTAAYTLPLLNKLLLEGNPDNVVKSLIIVPTRELAQQIDQQFQGFSYYLPVSTTVVYGGGDGKGWDVQKRGMLMGSDVVIATPGRMIAHLQNSGVDLSHVEYLILDEADRMLDMGFSDDIMKIVSYMPRERQTILFSATLPPKIRELAKTILRNPVEVSIAISKPNEAIDQSAYICYESQKLGIIRELFAEPTDSKTIIFSSSKMKVKELAHTLKRMKLNVAAMHSDLEQAQREEVMLAFKNNKVNILVATDIVARGIDIEDIGLVINYDVPHDPEDYIHRIGRTARAAATGSAITFVCEEEQGKFHTIEKFIEREIRKADLPESVGEGPKYNPEAFSGRGKGRGGRSKGGDGRGHGRGRRDRLRDNRGRSSSSTAPAPSPSAAETAPAGGAVPAAADAANAEAKRRRRHRGGRRHRRGGNGAAAPAGEPNKASEEEAGRNRNGAPGRAPRSLFSFAGLSGQLLPPLFAGERLQVRYGVLLVHDLHAEQRLDDILHGYDTLEAAVLVAHLGDVLLLLEHLLPDRRHGILPLEGEDRAPDIGQADVEAVLGEPFEHRLLEDVPRDVVGAFAVDRDTRIDAEEVVGVELPKRRTFGGRGRHGAGRHDLTDADVAQADKVLDHVVLAVLEDTLLTSDAHHRRNLLAAYREGLFLRGDELGDELREEHQRVADDDHRADTRSRDHGQLPPVAGSDGLGNDLRENEYEHCEHGGDDAEILLAEDLDGLGADPGGTDRVGDGVQREDCRDGFVDILLLPHEQRGVFGALLLLHGDERHGRREQDGFEDRTEERDGQCDRKIKDDKFHICGFAAPDRRDGFSYFSGE